MPRLVRITTLPVSMQVLLKGQMRYMKENGFDVTMISSDGPEVEALKAQEQCPHMSVQLTRKISPLTDLISFIRLVKIFRKIKPDIVHTHTPKAGLLGMWAAWIAAVPVRLHTIAGLPWIETKGAMRMLLKFVEKLTAMPASQIFPNSFVQQQFLLEQGIGTGKSKVLGRGSSNGINCAYFSKDIDQVAAASTLRASENMEAGAWVWIFVGRVVKDKGIGELLEAFETLNRQFPQDRLWLLGDEEPELDPLDEQHKKILHKHHAIRSWGFQKDIRPFLAAAEVLVFPSYREGFPNVPLQAGSMGCMLILSDINGCNEIVEHQVNGILVPVKNSSQLLSSMLSVRHDPEMKESFSQAIQQKIQTAYDQQTLWKILLEEYKNWLFIKKDKTSTK